MFPSDTDFESKFTFETQATPLDEEPPFHLLLLGDWSGNSSRTDLRQRRPILIDRDKFDEVMRKLNVVLDLDLQGDGETTLSLQFTELDDFHPDNLFGHVSLFEDLRDIRRRLLNADTFNSAAREVRSWFTNVESKEKPESEVPLISNETPPVNTENLLDQILSQPSETSASARPQATHSRELNAFIGKLVQPYLVPTDEAEQSKLLAVVDEATSELMRSILHHPQFQALESAWRGLHFLVRRVETDVDLKIFLLDVTKDELADNLKSVKTLTDSALYGWLIRETIETPGGQPWAVICGNYTFHLNIDDVATLMRVAQLANAAEAPFISYILPEMFGLKTIFEASDSANWKFSAETTTGKLWSTLRVLPESNFLGLSIIRFLSRLPYGAQTDSTETFSFEEFTDQIHHEHYLWANPSFFCAALLALSYRLNGWEMGQDLRRDIEGLPMHIYQQDDETKTKPCAEIVLTENISEKILEQGLMPLLSFRDSDRVRLGRFQAVSYPLTNLNGKWNL